MFIEPLHKIIINNLVYLSGTQVIEPEERGYRVVTPGSEHLPDTAEGLIGWEVLQYVVVGLVL